MRPLSSSVQRMAGIAPIANKKPLGEMPVLSGTNAPRVSLSIGREKCEIERPFAQDMGIEILEKRSMRVFGADLSACHHGCQWDSCLLATSSPRLTPTSASAEV